MRKIKNNLHGIKFDRHHLPKPFHYYSKHFPHLKMRAQWVSVHCCFHVDRQPSLRLNLETGAFRCFGCGVKGGDVLAFHQQLHKLTFIEAARFFGAWYD